MNKLTIPAILVATVMVAGAFAFMPVQQASTVHTSGTITIADGAITAAKIATDAIDADALKTDAVTEIQTGLSGVIVLTISDADPTEGTDVYTIDCDSNYSVDISIFNPDDGTTADESFTIAVGGTDVTDAIDPTTSGDAYFTEATATALAAEDVTITLGGTANGDDGTLEIDVLVFTADASATCTLIETI